MGKCLLRKWNFTRHEVNFITTKPDPEKNRGKNSQLLINTDLKSAKINSTVPKHEIQQIRSTSSLKTCFKIAILFLL